MDDADFMARAIALSSEALATPGAQPFGAVVVRDGRIVGEGLNRSAARFDPTSHGEVEAIRDACRNLRCTDLTGCDLYTSCEPCPLCVAAMTIVNIRKLFYAASLADSATALREVSPAVRRKVDTAELRREVGLPVDERGMPAERLMPDAAAAVLRDWASQVARG